MEILYTKAPESDYLDAALITVMQVRACVCVHGMHVARSKREERGEREREREGQGQREGSLCVALWRM